MDARRSFALVAMLFLAGCVTPTLRGDPESLPPAVRDGDRPVVIALLDTGTTPYYHVFDALDDSFIAGSVPFPFTRVELGPDGHEPRDRDWEIWKTLEPRTLYHFAGTRLLGISFDEDRSSFNGQREFPYVYDADFHGVATSYFAAREAPDAIIVMVQVGLGPCDGTSCLILPGLAEGMEWIAAQDWIDVVSVSLGMPGNAPDPGAAHPDVQRYLAASEKAAQSGKLIVVGAGNDASPTMQGFTNGAPWIIVVGGIEPAARGEHARSSKGVDVVSNFTDFGPMFGDGENDTAWRSGTSFATPIVAGTLANAWGQVRAADPWRLTTTQELRDAMNASATYFDASEWDPTPPGRKPLPDDLVSYVSLPILAQPQMGWGYVDSSLAGEVARRVMEGDLAVPPEKSQAAIFQANWQRAREEFWARYGG